MPSLYEHAGGEDAIHRLEDVFYSSVLADPLLMPLFGDGQPQHVDHLTAFTAESFGGPDRFSRELGFGHLIAVHRRLKISEAQRQRFVELYLAALDEVGMPDDEAFREAIRSHVEFGSQVACRTRTPSATGSPPAPRGAALDLVRRRLSPSPGLNDHGPLPSGPMVMTDTSRPARSPEPAASCSSQILPRISLRDHRSGRRRGR